MVETHAGKQAPAKRKRRGSDHDNVVTEAPRSADASDARVAVKRTEKSPALEENAIREFKRRGRGRPADQSASLTSEANRSAPADQRESGPRISSPVRSRSTETPPEVERRFVRVGRDFYFPDGALAFTDRGRKLTTPSENAEVVKSLVTIAQARGWQELTLTGTERFRKEAWMAAQAAGLATHGYKPTELERERVIRALARDREASAKGGAAAARPQSDIETGAPAPPARKDRVLAGRLVEHGRANYKHDPQAPASYFVRLETARGDRTVWGVDLERALRESLSQPKIGDDVAVRSVRREPVTVSSAQRDGQGHVVATKQIDAHRNRWSIEQRAFLEQREQAAQVFRDAKIAAGEGARAHPQLAGSYLQLRGAEEFAAQRIRDPQDQRQFVARVRAALADSIAQGEPLAPVRLRDRPAQKNRPPLEHALARA